MEELPIGENGLSGDGGPAGTDASLNIGNDGAIGRRDGDGGVIHGGDDDDAGRSDGGPKDDGGLSVDASPIDAGCIGLACGVFVNANAPNDNGLGTRDDPVKRISTGIDRASGRPKTTVYIAGGIYREKPIVLEGINLVGGWDCPEDFAKPCAEQPTVVEAIDDQGFVVGKTITDKTILQRLHIVTTSSANGDRTAMTITGGSPTLRALNIEFTAAPGPGAPAVMSSKSVGLRVTGNARPRIEKCQIRSAHATDESIGVTLASDPTSGVPMVMIKGGAIEGGQAAYSVGLRVGPSPFNGTSGSSLVEDVNISSWTWAVDAIGPVQLQSNRINHVRPATVNTSTAVCSTAGDPCGGGVRVRNSISLQGNYIAGANVAWSTAVYLAPEATGPVMRINGNTLHGGGVESATVPPFNSSISAAIVIQAKTASIKAGDVLNNILLGGANDSRYGVYELLPASNQSTKYTAHLKSFTHNNFAGVFTAAYRHSPDGVNYVFPNTPADVEAQVQLPAITPKTVFALEPMFLDDGYHLNQQSPLIDTGTPNEPQSLDVDTSARPKGAAKLMDIGADEVR